MHLLLSGGGNKLYRFLIADDEAIIRQGIHHLLDYEQLGFTICGEASTGEQTFQLLMELNPDVALVDIRMPEISGLEAIKRARQAGYRGKIIIISSISEFCYAQEAIRNGVDNYVVKPIDEEELANIFRELKVELDQQFTSSEHARLETILSGATQAFGADVFQILVFAPFNDDVCPGELRIPSISRKECEYCSIDNLQVALLKGRKAIQQFQDTCSLSDSKLLSPYFVVVGNEVSAQQLPESFQNLKVLLQRRFFLPSSQHFVRQADLNQSAQSSSITSELTEKYKQQLLSCIQTFNRQMIGATLVELHALFSSGYDTPDRIRLFFIDLYLQIKNTMNSRYPAGTISFWSNTDIIQRITDAKHLDEIIEFLSDRFDMIMSSTGGSNRDSVLDDVLHYIHHNYADNFTLEDIAPLFGYNPSYLGKIFRKKLGCSFTSYVDHVRIEKAKELLLSDNTKVYIIAEKVGYSNVDYFHIKFRKYVNQSPAEYRKANQNQHTD